MYLNIIYQRPRKVEKFGVKFRRSYIYMVGNDVDNIEDNL